MDSSSDAVKIDQIIEHLKNLEARVIRLENQQETILSDTDTYTKPSKINSQDITNRADFLEEEIGQFWFAKVGIVILSIGIAFLLTFPFENIPSLIICLAGYLLVGVLFGLAKFLKSSFEFLSQYFFGSGLLLLYFTTLRLHFFSNEPVIGNVIVVTTLLVAVTVTHLTISYKKESVYLIAIGITLAAITALISNNSISVTLFLVLLSFLIVHLQIKNGWNGLFVFGTLLIYVTNLLWFLNNPIMGNNVLIADHPSILLFTFLIYVSIFSYGVMERIKIESEKLGFLFYTIISCLVGYLIFLLISVLHYKGSLAILHLTASLILLLIAVFYWSKIESKYSIFVYSLLGYSALSVAIIAQFPQPDLFVWLCWQSLLVISTALWFRSKIIIVANFGMYIVIFISYLIVADEIGTIALSFGLVALISARILNWQKNRLDLKTENMRNAYLAAAFFIFPYALYHIVPKEFVGPSWTAVAIIYYVLSVILKNKKYRWMAILTFIITVFYLVTVGTTNLDPTLRIISFIGLGMVLLGISIYYGKNKSKRVTTG